MNQEQIIKITLSYPSRQGFIMLAYEIQQKMAKLTSQPIRLKEQQEGHFTVTINGSIMYDCTPLQLSEVDQAIIFEELSRYNLPKVTVTKVTNDSNDSNDPDHIEWMNCVCSGE